MSFLGYGSNGDPQQTATAPELAHCLTGAWGDYDACPLFNETPSWLITHRGNVTPSELSGVSSCNQDLREFPGAHNQSGVQCLQLDGGRIFGANICVDSTALIPLIDSNSSLKSATNFDFSNLGTAARLRRDGHGVRRATCNK